ncbi:DUF916 and DUF3324 domain-containing protein [Vagococcus fessus]|uniref:Uncharacterized protein n=1 Tax=Vagococcus fessus TaxID=120370 RepID=A0A430A8E2_9ENTE|nr:DUF916 and DUF3324 domain-containing protein [Vagococcus fessus]RSU03390.1 hypothetical protein CBF31_06670 [Vagococcus fessus]
MKKKIIYLILVMGAMVSMPNHGFAEGNSLSVQVEPHKNSIDKKDTSSFNLKVIPNENYNLKIKVKNGSKNKTSADIFINDAYTTPEGVIAYGEDEVELPESMINPISKLVTTKEKSIELNPDETKEIIFSLKAPKKEFKGIKLGAIYVLNAVSDSEKGKMFKNRFSYTVPLMLTESDEQIKPNLEFISLRNIQENKRNYLQIKLENTEQNILSRGIFKLDLFKGDKKIASQSKEEMSIAPNSYLPYQMQWGDNNVVSGTYTAKFSFDTPYGLWKWDKSFEISKKEAKDMNDSAIHVTEENSYLGYILGGSILLFIILVMTIGYFWMKKQKNNDKSKLN